MSKRIAHPNSQHKEHRFLATESLVVPKLTLSVSRSYSELVGRDVGGTNLHISSALQVIKFRLDETGLIVESEAVNIFDDEPSPASRPGKRRFVFDRPFLIYLSERNADQPYFAAWIENAALMTPVSSK